MPIQCAIRANDAQISKGILKGMVEEVQDMPCEWGNAVGPPDYVIVQIDDATKEQAETFLQTWKNVFRHDVSDADAETKRVVLSIDHKIVEVLGDGKALKQSLRELLINDWGVTVESYNSTSVTFTVPASSDLESMREQLMDQFEEVVAYRIYMFREADVDWALNNGGFANISRSQALTRIVDRRE